MEENKKPELVFPLECNFRIITEDVENMYMVISTVLLTLGITDPLEQGNRSSGGKYVSYNVTTTVESRDHMNRVDRELRNIAGVKMVL